ncbi:Uncharacterised protein [Porphyromonas macacae]|uniref:Uncharacterized protein n=1 Tax=Porphyromonas macacae TaxID=28115 RepID=A0A379E6M8_9PORP|nr:hypothetical protein [Porphyromonas macacae]SUB88367.1 Uncharacterised protein [Porphyromonas macacae]
MRSEIKEVPENLLQTISPYRFKLLIEESIPYTGYVWGIGYVKFHPEENIVLRSSEKAFPDEEEGQWLESVFREGPLVLGLGSIVLDQAADYTHKNNKNHLVKGIKKVDDLLKKNSKERRFMQRKSGYMTNRNPFSNRNVYNSFKWGGRLLSGSAVVLTGVDMKVHGINTGNTSDMVFGVIAFVPEVGWVISGIYTVADYVTVRATGKKISEHAEDFLFTKYVEFHNALKDFLNSLSPFSPPVFR